MTPVLEIAHVGGILTKGPDSLLEETDLAVVEAVGDICRDVAGGVACGDVLAVWDGLSE